MPRVPHSTSSGQPIARPPDGAADGRAANLYPLVAKAWQLHRGRCGAHDRKRQTMTSVAMIASSTLGDVISCSSSRGHRSDPDQPGREARPSARGLASARPARSGRNYGLWSGLAGRWPSSLATFYGGHPQ
jgi:hypothetical protein